MMYSVVFLLGFCLGVLSYRIIRTVIVFLMGMCVGLGKSFIETALELGYSTDSDRIKKYEGFQDRCIRVCAKLAEVPEEDYADFRESVLTEYITK